MTLAEIRALFDGVHHEDLLVRRHSADQLLNALPVLLDRIARLERVAEAAREVLALYDEPQPMSCFARVDTALRDALAALEGEIRARGET